MRGEAVEGGGRRLRFLMLNWRDPRNPRAGGAERVSVRFLQALQEQGHEVDWFAFGFPGATVDDECEGLRVRRGGGVGTAILAARRWVRSQRPYDLVVDQHHGVPWLAPWWSGTRSLAFIHEVLGPVWGTFYRWPINWLGPWQERWVLRLYRGVPFWVPSESTRKALMGLGIRQVRVLRNGVDLEPLATLEDKNREGTGRGRVRLLVVSRLAPNKRVEHAIEAVLELKRRGVDSTLSIVGDGLSRSRLEAQVVRKGLGGVVRFWGQVTEEEKRGHLREHDLLLHPSVREGWGLNVLEANAMGTPAVVYPVAGLVDSTVDGETGWVCGEERPESLADAVEMAWRDGRGYARVRRAAWERSKAFRWSAVLPEAVRFLEEAATGRKGVDT
jgi:glycosyltransferase involved in cell wall biosynthesis